MGSSKSLDPLAHLSTPLTDAQYYAQQGYDPHTIAAMTASSSQPQQGQQAQAGPSYTAAPAHARIPAGTQLLDQDLLAQSSVYLPGATEKLVKEGKYKPPPGKRQTVVRKGGGKTWEDTSLLDWDPSKCSKSSVRVRVCLSSPSTTNTEAEHR